MGKIEGLKSFTNINPKLLSENEDTEQPQPFTVILGYLYNKSDEIINSDWGKENFPDSFDFLISKKQVMRFCIAKRDGKLPPTLSKLDKILLFHVGELSKKDNVMKFNETGKNVTVDIENDVKPNSNGEYTSSGFSQDFSTAKSMANLNVQSIVESQKQINPKVTGYTITKTSETQNSETKIYTVTLVFTLNISKD